ncbi:hypothetical protein FACS189499_06160 [Clostridia bacterium]|nr:hypothetical protein FACS189499_06160 [Clostridia bacterium]
MKFRTNWTQKAKTKLKVKTTPKIKAKSKAKAKQTKPLIKIIFTRNNKVRRKCAFVSFDYTAE